MAKELISVICTVKNGSKTISATIDSVIKQTYSNWEMIIIDDGSTDETKEILQRYSESDARIKPVFTLGIGRGKALNKAVELASGEFVANLDGDDVFHPQKLEMQIKAFLDQPAVPFLIATKGVLFFDNELPTWKIIDDIDYDATECLLIKDELLRKNVINHSSVMMKKEQLIQSGAYSEQRKTQLDYELWLRAHSEDSVMYILDVTLTGKRIHANQSYENKKRVRYLYNSASLQMYYILKSSKYYLLVIPIIRFFAGLLPFKLRRTIKKYLRFDIFGK